MRKSLLKIIFTVFAAVALICLSYQIYLAHNPKITSEKIINYNYSDIGEFDSFIIRDEELLICDKAGVRSYTVVNGTRVAGNSSILNIYTSEEQAMLASQIDDIDKKISALSELEKSSVVEVGELESVKEQLSSKLSSLSDSVLKDELSELNNTKTDILTVLNKKSIILGEENDFSNQLSELREEKQKLEEKINDKPYEVKAPSAGYFVSFADGYENRLDISAPEQITPGKLDSAMKSQPDEIADNVIGKLSRGFLWYIAFNVEGETLEKLRDKDHVRVNIPSASIYDKTLPIVSFNYSEDNRKAAVILECNLMSVELSSLRMTEIQIVFDSKEGIKVPESAIHIKDIGDEKNCEGVYVIFGQKLKFKRLDIIYDSEDYVISKETNSSDYLREGDMVVTGGKDLYDGKFIG